MSDIMPVETLRQKGPLGRKAMNLVENVWKSKRVEERLVDYRKSNAKVKYRHAKALDPEHVTGWLDDEVLNLWFELCRARDEFLCSLDDSRRWSCFFSSFFYSHLKRNKGKHDSVKTWTRRVDVFQARYIYISINHETCGIGTHWSLCVVDIQRKRISEYDSLGRPKGEILDIILDWIEDEEFECKNGRDAKFNYEHWKFVLQDDLPHPTPQQNNGSDCGVYTAQFAAFLNEAREEVFDFGPTDIPDMRRRMMYSILYDQLV